LTVAFFLSAIWIATFFVDERLSVVSFFNYFSIFLLLLSPISFALINRKLLKGLNLIIRILLIAILAVFFSILWYSVINIVTPLICGLLNIPALKYFKEIETITVFLNQIDDSSVSAFIFALIWFILVAVGWYWVWFMNGAVKWSEGTIDFYKKFGLNDRGDFMVSPVAAKIGITIFLIVGLFAVYITTSSLLSN
jgi:hypothetical protein